MFPPTPVLLLSEVLALSHTVYLRISGELVITDAVGDTQALLGCEPETLIGMAPGELKDICFQLGVAVSKCLTSQAIQPGETWRFKDGVGCYYGLSDGSVVIKLTASLKEDQDIIGPLADQLPIMVAYVDHEGCFRLINRAYVDFIGISRENLYGQPVSSIFAAASYAKMWPRFQQALSGSEVNYEDRLALKDGRTIDVKAKYVPDFFAGEVIGFYAIIQDVSEYRAIIQLLRDIHSGVNRTDISASDIIDQLLHDALVYLSLDIGLVSRIIGEQYIIKLAASEIADIAPGDTFALGETYCRLMLYAKDVFYITQAEKDERVSGHPCYQQFGLESYIGTPLLLNGEVWGTLNFSSPSPRHQPFTHIEIELVKLITNTVERVLRDEAEIEQMRQDLDRMADKASRDYLTGLPNRSYLEQHVAALIRAHDTGDKTFSLSVIDIDHFKQFNDTYGHDTGDAVLQWLAARLTECLRDGDVVARIGGEEFVMVMHGAHSSEAKKIMERARTHIGTSALPFECETELFITISCGLSEHTKGESYADLFKRADAALYAAKESGRNQTCTP